jgi:protein-tyrosine phosphatase
MRNGQIAWDVSQIWERLWVGGHADAENLAHGNPHRISTVISLSEIPVEHKRRGINYLHLPAEDTEPIPVRQFDRILDALYENIRWGSLLIHCAEGISRAPSFTAAYMHAVGYKNLDAAIEEIRQMRPIIEPSNILLKNLKEYLK